MIHKANTRFIILQKILRNSNLSSKVKILVYKVVIRPIFCYALPIWFSFSPTYANKLEILERKILRMCVNKYYRSWNKRYSNNYIYNKCKVLPFKRYAFKLIHKFASSLSSHQNPLILNCIKSQLNHDWTNNRYLSPLGILRENIDLDPNSDNAFYSNFYIKATQHTHRG